MPAIQCMTWRLTLRQESAAGGANTGKRKASDLCASSGSPHSLVTATAHLV